MKRSNSLSNKFDFCKKKFLIFLYNCKKISKQILGKKFTSEERIKNFPKKKFSNLNFN